MAREDDIPESIVTRRSTGRMDDRDLTVSDADLADLLHRVRSTRWAVDGWEAGTDHAADSPALYDAMFIRSTRLPFGEYAPTALSAAFAELRAAVAPSVGDDDVEILTEVVWAALHGLVVLNRSGRVRPEQHLDRIDLTVARLLADAPPRHRPSHRGVDRQAVASDAPPR